MFSIYLTPASISYLTQFILSLAITIFLVQRLRNRNTQLVLLICFFVAATLFIGLMFLDAALLPFPRLLAVYAQNTVLALGLVFLLLFAYRFPRQFLRHKWEARAALTVSLAYLLWEVSFMVYRYVSLLGEGMVYYRPPVSAYANALVLLWVPVAFLRQSIAADPRPVNGLVKLWKPQGKEARGARSFVFIFAIPFVLGIINLLREFFFSTALYNISLSLGILAALWLFASTYINFIPGGVSVLTRLSILTLTLFLALLGSVGWLIAPPYIATYRPNLTDHQTLRFTPDASGGYTVTLVDSSFETELGDRLPVQHTNEGRNHRIDFAFPFYGQSYTRVYVASSGVIGMGEPFWQPNMQFRCANLPAIFPLMIDLDPNAGGGLYARRESDRLILTWDHLPALYRPEAIFTFQAVLYRDGVFDLTTNGLPLPFRFDPDETPSANPWVRGAAPGQGECLHTILNTLSGPLPEDQPARQALIQNYYLDFRQYLHTFIFPLSWVVIGGSLLLMAGLPTLLHFSIVKPLGDLTAGVRQMEAGDLKVKVPVTNQDEIGFLTNAFNTMAARLGELVTGLEERVAERTSELAAANRAKSVFLANMSHELRTPLNAILGFAQLLAREPNLTANQRQNLATINRSGEHLLALINGVLDMSKIEAGRVEVQPEEIDLRHLLVGLEEMFRLRVEQKGLALVVEDDPQVPRYVRTDQNKLREILINLLGNAVKFTQQGSITLRVKGRTVNGRQDVDDVSPRLPSADYHLQFEVEDTGPGIPIDELETIFEAFTQSNEGRQTQQGTGLGLTISRQYARLMGGDLIARNKSEPGSIFVLTVPVEIVEQTSQAQYGEMGQGRVVGLAEGQPVYRLLVVEDIAANRELLVKLLQPLGFELREAVNGQEAIDVWQIWQPHLILMDIRLPVLDGLEATRRIRAQQQESDQGTVIVAVTASAFKEDREQIVAAGCDDVLRKPLQETELFDALTRYLGVQFIYQDEAVARVAATEVLTPARLAVMPASWLADLQQAAVEGDLAWILRLIEQIENQEPDLADKLHQLADNFQINKILDIVRSATAD